jgi:hypothetical protein
VIHEAVVVAVQVQLFADAVTATDPEPPLSATVSDAGAIENVHAGGGAADWLTVKVFPAMVMVVDRAPPVFAETR